ncbi:hypothetical protein I4U23_017919 [Adineta vaga]|nr:hypothetical protein I4U23_017919 [Adineta vaga]
MCGKLDPDDLIDKVMFEDKNGHLCGQSLNRIYDISQVRHSLVVVDSLFIGGRNREVKKIMFFRPEWLRKFYILPVLPIAAEIQEQKRREAFNDLIDTCTIS